MASDSRSPWPSNMPAAMYRACCLAYDDDSSCVGVLETMRSTSAVQSLLGRLRSYRNRRLLVGDVKKAAMNSTTIAGGRPTKSEELAVAFKEKGNAFYIAKLYHLAFQCYNMMICCAKEESTRFVGISNKAACFYSSSQPRLALDLDEYLMEHEKAMSDARRTKIENRIEQCKKQQAVVAFMDAAELNNLQDEPEYPKVEVKSTTESDKGVYATTLINEAQSVFGAPIAPYAASLHARFESQRCNTCFRPLDYVPITTCKDCCVGFCSDECSRPHAPFCNLEWLSTVPPLSLIGFKTYVKSLLDPKTATEILNSQSILGRTPNGPSDSRDASEVYAPDIAIIHGLLTNESKVNFCSVLMPSCLDAVLITELLPEIAGLKLSARDLLTFILIANCNAFEVVQHEEQPSPEEKEKEEFAPVSIGFAQYGVPSLLNHSCMPNTINAYRDRTNHLAFRATKPIQKGEQVFHCYGPSFLVDDLAKRQSTLKEKYCFECHCEACAKEKLNPTSRNRFESEHELDSALENFRDANLTHPTNSILAHAVKDCLEELATVGEAVEKATSGMMPDFPRMLPALENWLKNTDRRYELLCLITKGDGFSIKREGLPVMPDSRNLQLAYASQHDQIASLASSMQLREKSFEYCKKSIMVLECWYPACSVELGVEYEKILSILFPDLLMKSGNGAKWLDDSLYYAKKGFRAYQVAYGNKDMRTKRIKTSLDAILQVELNQQLHAAKQRKAHRDNE